MTVGCVAGKFWPPHAGHLALIDAGLARVDQLHVIVIHRTHEVPDGPTRAGWIRELRPTAIVHVTPDDIPNTSPAWGDRTQQLLGRAPDIVLTGSEDYGITWAAALGATHVALVRDGVSGTAVRADPRGQWTHLAGPLRAHYAQRVVLLGAESTGKTVLAERVAAHVDTTWAPEFGRLVGEEQGWQAGDWEQDDQVFAAIAREQPQIEARAAESSTGVVVCDTDLIQTLIWHEAYRPGDDAGLAVVIAAEREHRTAAPDRRYLLCLDDVPWVNDGTRGYGSADPDVLGSRPWCTRRLGERLAERDLPFTIVSGSWEERWRTAIANLDQTV